MTILAIMSIVLALCGATVTGIKECRAAFSTNVKTLFDTVDEAFRKIDGEAGTSAQNACTGDKRAKKCERFSAAQEQLTSFNRAHWWYDHLIWGPILTLLIVALMLSARLLLIPVVEFRQIVANPTDGTISCLRWILSLSIVVNLISSLCMCWAYKSMGGFASKLSDTAATFAAAGTELQALPPQANPPT